MMEQKERPLDITMCHRCLMRQKTEDEAMRVQRGKRVYGGVAWLSEGVYAVVPEMDPQICKILSIGHEAMDFVYFSRDGQALEPGGLSSAGIVVVGKGFLADSLPFKVLSDAPIEEMNEKVTKRICKVQLLALNETSKGQINHVVFLKEAAAIQ